MNKLKTFFYIFKKSIASPDYYKELLETKFSYSVKYFLVLSIFASLITSAFVSVKTIPSLKSGINNFAKQVKESFPDDLVISFKSGQWTINRPEPFMVAMPKGADIKIDDKTVDNAVVFLKTGTIDDLEKFNTYSLFNETNFLYRDDTNGITVKPLKDFPDAEINKPNVNNLVDKAYTYLAYLPYFLPVLIFASILLFNYWGGKIIYILWVGLLVYLFTLIRKDKIGYKNSCRIAIHTMTIPLLVDLVLTCVGVVLPIQGWFLVANLILAGFIVIKMQKSGSLLETSPKTK